MAAMRDILNDEFYPLSHAQQRIWLAEQRYPGTPLSNVAGLLRIDGPIDAHRLAQAAQIFRNGTATLRTEIAVVDGQPMQRLAPGPLPAVEVIDFTHLAAPEAAAREWARLRCRRVFAVPGGGLSDLAVLRWADDRVALFACVHHLIADAASMALLGRGVGRIYETLAAGEDVELATERLTTPYRPYVDAERAYLSSAAAASDLAAWRAALAGFTEPSLLADDSAARTGTESTRVGAVLDTEETAALHARIRERGTTVARVFTAATAALVGRLLGQDDICLGSYVHGRDRASLRTFGMTVATVPVRARLGYTEPFSALVEDVGATLQSTLRRARYPYDLLVAHGAVATAPFDVVVSHQSQRYQGSVAGWPVTVEWLPTGHAPHAVTIQVSDRTEAGCLRVDVDAQREVVSPELAGEIAESLLELTRGVIAGPDTAVRDLPLLGPRQRARAVVDGSGPLADAPSVARLADASPDAIAVVAADGVLTYRQLESRVARLASRLRAHGAGPGSVVALVCSRRCDLITAQTGILRAGAAYLPIDPGTPPQRMRQVTNDAAVRIAVVDDQTAAAVAAARVGATAVRVTGGEGDGDDDHDAPSAAEPSASDLAYLIYTSGSLGRPKGVMIEHQAIANFVQAMPRALPLAGAERYLCATTVSFDIFALETLVPLTLGRTIVLADEADQADPDRLAALILRERCDVVQLVPSRLQLLLERPAGREALAATKVVLVGGESLPAPALRRLQSRTRARIFNLYGPTETTVWSTVAELTTSTEVVVGRPIQSTRVAVLAPGGARDLLPPGFTGEVCIGGSGLARGYLGAGALTAERFIDAGELGRLYRTGDRGRLRADGTLEHHGRLDHQVKVRGYRIELGEVEAQILASGLAAAAVVVRRDDPSGTGYLAGFYVPRGESAPEDLRAHLAAVLPDVMVPSALVPLPELPTLANGKVDRRALPATTLNSQGAAPTPPRDEIEEQLWAMWRSVLGEGHFGVTDRLSDVGGHSLHAVRIAALVESRFERRVALAELLSLSVRDLAGIAGAPRDDRPSAPALRPAVADAAAGGVRRFPASAAQRRMFLEAARNPDAATSYHMTGGLWLDADVDPARLQDAFAALAARHPALRSSFEFDDDDVVQCIHDTVAVAIEFFEVSPGESGDAIAGQFPRRFGLDQGPLWRAGLARGAADAAGRTLLVVDLHHLIADAASLEVLISDLVQLYAGEDPAPAPLGPHDFAVWQRQLASSLAGQQHTGYWQRALADLPQPIAFRAAEPGGRPGLHVKPLPEPLCAALSAGASGGPPFAALAAAVSLALGRRSDAGKTMIGVPVTVRPDPDLSRAVGLFVDTVPICLPLPETGTLSELVTAAGRRVHEAIDHAVLTPDMSREASPNVLLVAEPPPSPQPLAMPVERLAHRPALAKVDLTLNLVAGERAPLELHFTWRAGVLSPAEVTALANGLVQILTEITTRPEAPIADIEVVGPRERAHLLEQLRPAEPPSSSEPSSLASMLDDQVARAPTAIAVADDDRHLTYAELDRRTNRLARTLRARGAGPETVVAVLTPPSVDLVTAVLAVVKARAAWLPLDPTQPQERLRALLRQSGARVLVAPPGTTGELDLPLVELSDDAWDDDDTALDLSPGSTAELLYVIYTSGTTGMPKGVMIEQRQLIAQGRWLRRFLPSAERLRHMFLVSPAVDVSVHQIFLPLLRGDTLYLPTAETVRDVDELARYVRRHRIDVIDSVPSLIGALVDELDTGGDDEPLDVEYLCCGGDVLPPQLLRSLGGSVRARYLVNYYGPTETCLNAAALLVPVSAAPAHVPIGNPVDGYRVYLLDSRLRLVPRGQVGELCVGGPGVARGYLGQPDVTAEHFVPDPFVSGARMYRTGDLGRLGPDGLLEFVGRIDQQVKISGHRVELAEIEATLRALAGVFDCAVIAVGDAPGQRRLVAFVAAHQAAAWTPEDVRSEVRQRLPAYMVPSEIALVDELPRTPTGKVDRKALATAAGRHAPSGHSVGAPPRPGLEHELAEIWRAVLGVDEVHRDSRFFDLGGQSLHAMRFAARARRVLGVDLPLTVVFAGHTLADLAAQLDTGSGERPAVRPAASIPRLPPAAERLPSMSQTRFWLLDQLEPGSPLYTIAGGVRLRGALDVDAARTAIAELGRRHEVLRARFCRRSDGLPVMTIAEQSPFVLDMRDASNAPSATDIDALMTAEAQRPFDLERGPMARAVLFRVGAEDHLLCLAMHHIIADGWSLDILVREFGQLYAAARGRATAELPPLPIQFSDFAAWQRAQLDEDAIAREVSFWRAELGDIPVLELALDRPRPPLQAHSGTTVHQRVPEAVSDQVRLLCQRLGATPFQVLLAAWAALLHRYSGQDAVVVGTPVANRDRVEVETVVGCFVNTLPIRVDVTAQMPFDELVAAVRARAVAAYAHQELPFEVLVERLQPERDLSRTPLFQTMLVVEGAPEDALQIDELEVRPIEVDTGTAKLDLTLRVLDRGSGALELALEHNDVIWQRSTCARMLEHLGGLLAGVGARATTRVADLPLTGAEARRALDGMQWGPRSSLAGPATLHERVAAHAARAPDAAALLQLDGARLAFADLDRLANQMAHLLRSAGVGLESRVGLRVARSPEAVVAMLAVLKAGGAFVPLDPATISADRARRLLDDAGVDLVITRDGDRDGIDGGPWHTLSVDLSDPQLGRQLSTPPAVAVPPDALAYLVYTSGTTGVPKAVMVPHRAIVNFVDAIGSYYRIESADRLMQFHTLSFDAAIYEIFASLGNGASLLLRDRACAESTPKLLAACERFQVSILLLPTAFWAQMADEMARTRLRLPAAVRALAVAGEALPGAKARLWRSLDPRWPLVNEYGPTEATVLMSLCDVSQLADGDLDGSMPLGHPIANTAMYVLDSQLEPCPVGVPGELYIGGECLARGYLARADSTAAAFVPDPRAPRPGARMYRTGDRARRLADGMVQYLGRTDHQVKIRGYRVELGEIEAALAAHSDVQDAVVIVREDTPGLSRLVGYVVPSDTISPSSLREALRGILPDYMVPSAIVSVPGLPLTASGKVDRDALPAPADDTGTGRAPETPTEKVLAALFARLLARDRVSADDDFFALGGHSLLATQLVARILAEVDVDLPLRVVFEHPTVARLAAAIDRSRSEGRSRPGDRDEPLRRADRRAARRIRR